VTKVDFYILQQGDENAAMHFACRLAEKAYRSNHTVYLHCDDLAASEALEKMLWQYRDESFVPHSCHPGDKNPVLIGCGEHAGEHGDVMINLAQEIPGFFSRFHRLAEIVAQQPARLKASRERYSLYNNRGYPLNTYSIST
jgi:DNA polymerase-3 subunit chi